MQRQKTEQNAPSAPFRQRIECFCSKNTAFFFLFKSFLWSHLNILNHQFSTSGHILVSTLQNVSHHSGFDLLLFRSRGLSCNQAFLFQSATRNITLTPVCMCLGFLQVFQSAVVCQLKSSSSSTRWSSLADLRYESSLSMTLMNFWRVRSRLLLMILSVWFKLHCVWSNLSSYLGVTSDSLKGFL